MAYEIVPECHSRDCASMRAFRPSKGAYRNRTGALSQWCHCPRKAPV